MQHPGQRLQIRSLKLMFNRESDNQADNKYCDFSHEKRCRRCGERCLQASPGDIAGPVKVSPVSSHA